MSLNISYRLYTEKIALVLVPCTGVGPCAMHWSRCSVVCSATNNSHVWLLYINIIIQNMMNNRIIINYEIII